ncbi:putative leucine-rich repeat-containing protein DDB_G0290503 [Dendroctonus ponderosae]|uniref:Uncharacterized protein n=2 Tax=Dendroctonus ponderosae TaxID=77166 RepID=A0AAR5P2V3_DENPD|nr:putative leucine-rich repeat-containing protein DDB_G0290503 [Dendroctonus ponderosae]KAH1003884.1 hypothetical protein HUJ04_003725 [Dendroctonus ponderosae]KAH1010424.1 hypothetical protein HUJ05_004724 [Dendroctonus ponderosae]
MDNIEVESNGSYSLDSLRSDVSSLLGLSAYGAEFAELKQLVNDSEHYEQISASSSTSEADRDLITKEYEEPVTYLQGNGKNANRIQKLVKTNRQLELELENSNKQIERLIRNYQNKQNLQAFQSTLDLEKENYQLKLQYSKLRKQSAATQQERDELNRENAHLKVSLEECTLERDIQLKSINSLKEKVCELHVANENLLKYVSNLKFTQNVLNARLLDSYRSRIWYKKQLAGCQHAKSKFHGELITCKSEIADYINQISGLTADLIQCKNEYEQLIEASNEKLATPIISLPFDIKKCEQLASCADSVEKSAVLNNTASQEYVYIQTIAELKEEIGQIRAANLDNHRSLDNLKCKHSATIAMNLSLETILTQKDLDIKLLTCSKDDLIVQVECLRSKNKEQLSENQQLKKSLLILEVKLHHRKRENANVENCIEAIRDQLIGLNKIHQKVKNELYLKTTELATLKENNREVMDNWSVCKLRQNKLETLIARLRKDNESCESSIKELKDELVKIKIIGEKRQFPQETPRTSSKMRSPHSHHKCDNATSERSLSVLELTNLNMDAFSQHNLERITDDQKVELLFNNQPFPNSFKSNVDVTSTSLPPFHNRKNCIAKLHIEGFEKGMDTTLEYLADPINVYGRRLNPEYDSADKLQINKIKELNILLQVKEREIQEKRRKMDTNNRILLRKVKEHMRGRNAAEKQLKQLQELYNHLACDRNNLKMLLNSRDSELKTLQELCEDFKVESEKQRTSIVILEYQLRKIQTCWKCMKLQENNQCLEAELDQAKKDVELLQSKNNVLETKVLSQQQQIVTLSSENEGKNMENVQQELLEKLQSQLVNADKYSEKNEKLNAKLADCANRNEIHSTELQTHSSNFHRFVEFCQELQQQVDGLQNRLFEENTTFQKHIADYKSKMQSLQTIIQVLHNDRSFLHRISRDLKLSLNSCMGRNQKLQEQIRLFSSDNHVLKSRSRFLDDRLPVGNWDDTSINQLLQKCSGTSDKAVIGGLQSHLNGLRDEIFNLQEQILRKKSETC